MKSVTTNHEPRNPNDKVISAQVEKEEITTVPADSIEKPRRTCEDCDENIFCEMAFYNDRRCEYAESGK